jgi:membrane-associated phospholipid phosphatase
MVFLVVFVLWLAVSLESPRTRHATDQVDAFILRGLARVRTDWLTMTARGIDRLATGWTSFFVAIALLTATAVCRRWRHLFTFLGSVIVLVIIGQALINAFKRPRPYDVTAIGRWQGFSLPSATAAIVSFTAVGIVYMLVVPGHPREVAKRLAFVAVALVVLSRMYLGIDHPSDVLAGIALGVAIPLNGFRFFTPNGVPNHVSEGKTAHLDIGGQGEALRSEPPSARSDVVVFAPSASADSGESTPLRALPGPRYVLSGKLCDESRPRRPVVQDGPHHFVRPPRGRDSVPVGAPSRAVRGLRTSRHARRRRADGDAGRHRATDS